MPDEQGIAQQSAARIGAVNPRALAELKLGRTLDPKAPDFRKTVAEALGTDFDRLFDPKFGSPVFAGLRTAFRPPVLQQVAETDPPAIAKRAIDAGTTAVRTGGAAGAGGVAQAVRPVDTLRRIDTLNPVEAVQPVTPAKHMTPPFSDTIREITVPVWFPWLLGDLTYKYTGQFIVDVPTATGPVQGALADCWLISAMASVAWCHSDAIAERTLRTGDGVLADQQAAYEFTFFAPPNWGVPQVRSARDDVPVSSSGQYIYARSGVAGETWPANMEKTFIAMRGETGFFQPASTNYNELNYGDPAWAVASLVGRAPFYVNANDASAWSAISARCSNGRATTPMCAWTYGTAPAGLDYDSSGIVGNHAYSILGTETADGQNYVVLRNPWGFHEGEVDVLPGLWQGLTMPDDGVFALRFDAFARYYAAFGGA